MAQSATTRSRPVWPVAAGLLAIAGWVCSGVLLVAHMALAADGSLGLRICSAGSDCATVLKSPKAVLWGLPLGGWGMIYFAALAGWLFVIGLPRGRARRHLPVIAGVTAGVVVSILCLHWMAHSINAFCPWCSATHGVNFLLAGVLLTGWLALPRRPRRLRRVPGPIASLVMLGQFILIAHLSAGIRSAHSRLHGPGRIAEIVRAWRDAPDQEPQVAKDDLVYGRPDARHTLVVFSDYRCQYCRQGHEAVTGLLKRMPDRLRVVVKQFPFHPSCNPSVLVPRALHQRSCPAARAAVAAYQAGGADTARRYTDLLFGFPADDSLSDRRLAELAGRAGIDPGKWRTAYAADPSEVRLRRDIAEGRRLNVEVVPTFLLDGRLLPDILIPDPGSGDVDWANTMKLWERLLSHELVGASKRMSPPATRAGGEIGATVRRAGSATCGQSLTPMRF